MLQQAPRFDVAGAERIAHEHFGFHGTATPLTSERDQNFLIARADGSRIVLKIANATESKDMLLAQQRALVHLSPALSTTPRLVHATDGLALLEIAAGDDKRHFVWAVTWLPGRPLGEATRRTPALFEDFGRQVGTLDSALASFDHPAIHRAFYWDLANGRAIIDEHRQLISDADVRAALEHFVEEFDRTTAPLLGALPRSAIHSDLNDYNVLVGGGDDVETRDQAYYGHRRLRRHGAQLSRR
jgi:hydroxylysine kinase